MIKVIDYPQGGTKCSPDCTKRHSGCHSKCPNYKLWKMLNDFDSKAAREANAPYRASSTSYKENMFKTHKVRKINI